MTNLRPTDVSLRRRLGPRRVSVPRGQLSPSRLHLRIFSLNNILSKWMNAMKILVWQKNRKFSLHQLRRCVGTQLWRKNMFGIVFVGLMGHYPILEIILIRTEGALRSPLTYDDHPIHPSTPIPTFQNAEIGPQEKAPRRWSAFYYGASPGEW